MKSSGWSPTNISKKSESLPPTGGPDFSRPPAANFSSALAPEVRVAKPPHDYSPARTNSYFVTAKTWQSVPLFQSSRVADLFLRTLFAYRDQGKFHVHEFVLMPDHLHILLTPGPHTTLERVLQLIKGGFSHRAGKELKLRREIWQRGYVDHRIRDGQDYAYHRVYVHQNPVRANLAVAAQNYPYCSAFPGFQLDPAPQGLKPD